MAELEYFMLTATLTAIVVDYTDAGDTPDQQRISGTLELRPRIPTGKLLWLPTLDPPQGIALAPIKARFDTDGVLRTIQNAAVNELQTVMVTGDPFTLSFKGEPTGDLAQSSTFAQVETALEALSTVGVSNVNVTGPDGGPFDVVFNDALGNQDVPPYPASAFGNDGASLGMPGGMGGGGDALGGLGSIVRGIIPQPLGQIIPAGPAMAPDQFEPGIPGSGGKTMLPSGAALANGQGGGNNVNQSINCAG